MGEDDEVGLPERTFGTDQNGEKEEGIRSEMEKITRGHVRRMWKRERERANLLLYLLPFLSCLAISLPPAFLPVLGVHLSPQCAARGEIADITAGSGS